MGKLRINREAHDREGYTREDGTHVEATHVPAATFLTEDKGEPNRTPESEQWYHPKVHMEWHKDMPTEERRRNALAAHKGDELDTARALNALSNITTDEQTRVAAWTDAQYFYNLHKGKTIKGYGVNKPMGEGRPQHYKKQRNYRHGRILTRGGSLVKIHRGSVLRG